VNSFNDEMLLDEDEIGIEEDDDLNFSNTEMFSKAVIWGTDWTAETIINQLNKKNIKIDPNFQRRDAWNANQKSLFIESLILGIPVPPIILAEKKEQKNSFIVIDGKQRLLSLIQFSANDDSDFEQLKLSKLKILKELNGLSYSDIEKKSDLYDYQTQFDNQTIRTVVIRNWQNEDYLYTIFHRLNTGSMKLNSQELRQALYPGDFVYYADDFSIQSTQLQSILKNKQPDKRMRDIELLLRYFAFKKFIASYDGNLKDILDKTWKNLNDNWESDKENIKKEAEELNNAIDFVFEIFGEKSAFSKYLNGEFKNSLNRGVFDIMVYYFSQNDIRIKLENKKNDVKALFIQLCEKPKFLRTIEYSVKGLEQVRTRFDFWREGLSGLLGEELHKIWD